MKTNWGWALAMAAWVTPAFADVEWETELESAQQKAAAEAKNVLISFTGTDWCSWCIKFRRDVLSRLAFEQYIADKFVPVEIDVPNNPARVGGAKQQEANKKICERYGVDTFPSLLVTTADGQAAGGVVGGADWEQVEDELNIALDNVRLLHLANTQQGHTRLQTLLEVYHCLQDKFEAPAKKLLAEIVETDTEDALGLRSQMLLLQEHDALEARLNAVAHDEAALLALIQEEIPKVSPELLQLLEDTRINIIQGRIYQDLAKVQTIEDVLRIKQRLLLELVPVLPAEDRAEIKAQIELEFADPQKMLDLHRQ